MTLRFRIASSLVALANIMVVPVTAQAQPAVTSSSAYSTVGAGSETAAGRWDYTFTFLRLCPCGAGASAQISIEFPNAVAISVTEDKALWSLSTSATGAATFTRLDNLADGMTLKVRAEAPLSGFSRGTVSWTSTRNGSLTRQTDALEGPGAKPESKPKWSTLVGGGFSVLLDDYTDFETENDVLVIKNNSKLRATALTGIGFSVKDRWGIMAGVEYTAGTTALLDAFNAGVTYRFGDDVALVAGIAAVKGRELSPGFERAAAAFVTANPDRFPGLEVKDGGSGLKGLSSYDGLPIKDIGYQGRVITDSWNTSLFVGVAFPISIKLGSDKDRAQLSKAGGGQ